MHVAQADTQGSASIGLYAHITNTHCVLGPEAENLKPLIEEVLQVPVVITTIAGTSLAGIFCAGYDDVILVPGIVFAHEVDRLERAGMTVRVIDTRSTALGNNIAVTPSGALVGPVFTDAEIDAIAAALDVPVNQVRIADVEVVGSCIASNTSGCVCHPQATALERDLVQDSLGLSRALPGTVNLGSPYVRGGILANDRGFLVGNASGGPEITNADEALGFLEG